MIQKADGKVYKQYGSLKALEEELSGHDFLRIHKSFLVNQKYIDEIGKREVRLLDGSVLEMGRDRRKALREAMSEYEEVPIMSEAKLEKQKKKLVELGVMQQEDALIDFLQASYVEQLIGKFGQWKQGWTYFTQQRLIIITGVLEENIVTPYDSIRGLEKCNQGLFPMGISITYESANGTQATTKISLRKRNKWITFLQEKAHTM